MSAESKSVVGKIVGALPPPDELDAMDDKPMDDEPAKDDEGDDEAKSAAKTSAAADLCSALGVSPKKAAAVMAALDDYLEHCDGE